MPWLRGRVEAQQDEVNGIGSLRARRVWVSPFSRGKLVVDVRSLEPEHRRAVLFAVVDKLVELDAQDEVVIVSDHDPSGMTYQIDLRRETRGLFETTCDQRSDGAWVALLQRRRR